MWLLFDYLLSTFKSEEVMCCTKLYCFDVFVLNHLIILLFLLLKMIFYFIKNNIILVLDSSHADSC